MARLAIKEENKFIFLTYLNGLSPYIQQNMEFLTISTLADAFHYTSKIEAKQKGKSCFANKPIGQTSDKKSLANSDNFKHPYQPTPQNPDHHKNKF